MKLSDGRDALEFERAGDILRVKVTGAQIAMASMEVIRHHARIGPDAFDEFAAVVEYAVPPGAVTLRQATLSARTRLARLQTAQRLATLVPRAAGFRVPFLHPENILLTGAGARPAHSGLAGMLAPMDSDDARFLVGYKALVLSVFHPRLPFEHLVDGSAALTDALSMTVSGLGTPEEISAFIDAECLSESHRAARRTATVPRLRHRLLTGGGTAAIVGAAVLGWFTYVSYVQTVPKQEAIIAAQAEFLTRDYARALAELRDYSPGDLPRSARYILAASSIELAELTGTQKQAVLDSISTKTDDNTLGYWIHLARGELDRALSLAQNLGDDQLTLLAYTELYEATKLDARMDGATKQKRLEDYSAKIDDLTGRLRVER
ncbi:type VII secretion protein EssB [Leifsonia shinshuensis]|uniref:type VII secretion protein EssB n=1 Tax=Leifsonia shinshuensis TaxID=150026 RepID=UPI002856112C|nr:type VII secretion protein EssB [Leifsonia shinshuensis]MDR6971801.1 type VII secretion protein EssB [Leifsonia shinshuensis]